jgi:ubiquinone/menaquinone biosynthesis C-methylase UbiE
MKQDVLDEIKAKADEHKLDNIKLMKTDGQLQIDIENDSVDMAIFYDVLHMYKKDQRRKIYDEVTRMLKPDGIFSVYPKHCKCDHPEREFRLIDAHEIRQEIESCDFICDSQYTGRLSHADDINNGCVFNFIRK